MKSLVPKKYQGSIIQVSPEFVPFYGQEGEDLLSNFWILEKPMKMSINGKEYEFKTSEAAYQAANKYDDDKIIQLFTETKTGEEAFLLSRKYQPTIQNYMENKIKVMKEVLKIKFSNQEFRKVLLETQDAYLVEHTPSKNRDPFWSDDHDGTGKNMLGLLLMELRQELGGVGIVNPPNEYKDWIKKVQ